jgi:predicted nuclease of restriction endonuclease-like (RecB) superfamily
MELIRVENADAGAFYENEAVREGWSTRELERQISSLLYERLAKSRDKDAVLPADIRCICRRKRSCAKS